MAVTCWGWSSRGGGLGVALEGDAQGLGAALGGGQGVALGGGAWRSGARGGDARGLGPALGAGGGVKLFLAGGGSLRK
jgi:hypothetical protein